MHDHPLPCCIPFLSMSASQGPVPFSMYTANTLSAIGMSVKVQLVADLMRLSPNTLHGAVPHCMVETDGSLHGDASDGMCGQYAGDRYISYLPLAHIYERVVITSVTYRAMSVGFYR